MVLSNDCTSISECYLLSQINHRYKQIKSGAPLPLLGVFFIGLITTLTSWPELANQKVELANRFSEVSSFGYKLLQFSIVSVVLLLIAMITIILMQLIMYRQISNQYKHLSSQLKKSCLYNELKCINNDSSSNIRERAIAFSNDDKLMNLLKTKISLSSGG